MIMLINLSTSSSSFTTQHSHPPQNHIGLRQPTIYFPVGSTGRCLPTIRKERIWLYPPTCGVSMGPTVRLGPNDAAHLSPAWIRGGAVGWVLPRHTRPWQRPRHLLHSLCTRQVLPRLIQMQMHDFGDIPCSQRRDDM